VRPDTVSPHVEYGTDISWMTLISVYFKFSGVIVRAMSKPVMITFPASRQWLPGSWASIRQLEPL
jgi:hypothetical protein